MNWDTPARVFVDGLDHPEGIAVSTDGSIWTGGEAGQVYRIDPVDLQTEVVALLDSQVLGVALDLDGSCVCCCPSGIFRVSRDGDVDLIADRVEGRSVVLPNFPVFDAEGTLYVSDSGVVDEPSGRVYRFGRDSEGTVFHHGPLAYANGLAIGPEGDYLYVVQTMADNVVRVPLDGHDSRLEPVCAPGSLLAMPDGLAFDEHGDLLVTSFGEDAIQRIATDGSIDTVAIDTRAMTMNRVTNCAFGLWPSSELYLANLGGTMISVLDVGVRGAPLFGQSAGESRSGASERG